MNKKSSNKFYIVALTDLETFQSDLQKAPSYEQYTILQSLDKAKEYIQYMKLILDLDSDLDGELEIIVSGIDEKDKSEEIAIIEEYIGDYNSIYNDYNDPNQEFLVLECKTINPKITDIDPNPILESLQKYRPDNSAQYLKSLEDQQFSLRESLRKIEEEIKSLKNE